MAYVRGWVREGDRERRIVERIDRASTAGPAAGWKMGSRLELKRRKRRTGGVLKNCDSNVAGQCRLVSESIRIFKGPFYPSHEMMMGKSPKTLI